ncbi:MAG: oligoendopeptidase, partial [Bacillales bacterium]|nr:oligoendopeptidase [Bacillales bacterium]
MKFQDFQYVRPSMDTWKITFDAKLEDFKNAENLEAQVKAMDEINVLRNSMDTMKTLCSIRYTIDSTDEFYTAEQDYFDEISPLIEEKVTEFYKELVTSKFKSSLEEKYGRQLFALAEGQLKTFSPEIIELLQQENRLTSEYGKLVASAKIPFDGKELTLSQFGPYRENTNREIRRSSTDTMFGYYSDHIEKFDGIYDQLVKIRTEIAHKLGYKNYTELGYYR